MKTQLVKRRLLAFTKEINLIQFLPLLLDLYLALSLLGQFLRSSLKAIHYRKTRQYTKEVVGSGRIHRASTAAASATSSLVLQQKIKALCACSFSSSIFREQKSWPLFLSKKGGERHGWESEKTWNSTTSQPAVIWKTQNFLLQISSGRLVWYKNSMSRFNCPENAICDEAPLLTPCFLLLFYTLKDLFLLGSLQKQLRSYLSYLPRTLFS